MFTDSVIEDEIKGIFPNICKTGIEDVDKDYIPKEDTKDFSFGLGDFGNLAGIGKAKKKEFKWKKFIKNNDQFDI